MRDYTDGINDSIELIKTFISKKDCFNRVSNVNLATDNTLKFIIRELESIKERKEQNVNNS